MDDSQILPQDGIFNTSVRLSVMLILIKYKKANFTRLQILLQVTAGNLDFHLSKLEEVHYIERKKSFLTGRLSTMIEITDEGKKAFKDFLKKFKHILRQIDV